MEELNPTLNEPVCERRTLKEIFETVSRYDFFRNAAWLDGCFYYSILDKVIGIDPYTKKQTVWHTFDKEIQFFGFSNDKKRYFVSFYDGTQRVGNIETRSELALQRHDRCVFHMIEYGEDQVISISEKHIRRHNIATGQLVLEYSGDFRWYSVFHSNPVLDDSGDILFLACDLDICSFCNKTGKCISKKKMNNHVSTTIARFDATTLVVAGERKIRLYDHVADTIKAEYPFEFFEVYKPVMAPDGRHLLIGGDRQTYFCIFDMHTKKMVSKIRTNADGITQFVLSEDGSKVCVAGYNGVGGRGRVSILEIAPAFKK